MRREYGANILALLEQAQEVANEFDRTLRDVLDDMETVLTRTEETRQEVL